MARLYRDPHFARGCPDGVAVPTVAGAVAGAPLNRLIDEMTTLMLAEFDAETRFRLRAQNGTGKTQRGLELLDKLDAHFEGSKGESSVLP